GNTLALVAFARLHDNVEACLWIIGFKKLGESAAARHCTNVGNEQDIPRIRTPQKLIRVDAPLVSDLTHGSDDLRDVAQGWISGRARRLSRRDAGGKRSVRPGVGQNDLSVLVIAAREGP